MTSPADATPDQRRAYEQACAAALRRRFENDGQTLFNGRRVTALAVRGEYPDTDMVVTFVDARGATDSEAFNIWREDPPGDVDDPNDAGLTADVIWVSIAGM